MIGDLGVRDATELAGLVADGTPDSKPYGKQLSDTVDGFADVLIVQ